MALIGACKIKGTVLKMTK